MNQISIYDLWLSFQSYSNTFQGGWYRPQSDFQQRVNDFSKELFIEYSNEAERSQKARDNLFFLLKSAQIKCDKVKANYSIVKPPAGYARFSGMSILVTPEGETCEDSGGDDENRESDYLENISRVSVELIDSMRWDSCLQHETKKPTLGKPKTTFMSEAFRVAPRSITSVILDYYIEPEDAVFAYTVTPVDNRDGEGGVIVFDKSRSRNLPWPETMKNEFIVRLGESYGLFTRDSLMTQFSTQQKTMV